MHISILAKGLACAVAVQASLPEPACVFSNGPDCIQNDNFRIPTSAESAVMGRRVLAKGKFGTLATVFPEEASSQENRPPGMGGVPIGLMDYVADCEDTGNPTLLAIQIATSFKNIRAGSNLSLSMRWNPPYNPAKRIGFASALDFFVGFRWRRALAEPDPTPYSAANLPRFSLFGYAEWIAPGEAGKHAALRACFAEKHADAKYWMPGNRIHESGWMRLVVTHVYWIGGFGDRAYIGWIPVDEWRNVTDEQWSSIRLQGETEGWNEWDPPPTTGKAASASLMPLDL
jgi:Pyridoxamine 5'-phosphate oxidase